ncbi:MAG: hypothetical protein KJZ53_05280 [Anaerolineales bacterium]|nr:hypothetical protein [Anaerolineales bacterium]
MLRLSAKQYLIYGFLMVLFGFIMPWLFILRIVQINFFLAFLSYAVSWAGLLFGIIGIAMIGLERRHKDRRAREEYGEYDE